MWKVKIQIFIPEIIPNFFSLVLFGKVLGEPAPMLAPW
jgi:hypothetical protein